jgi:hypothetical protein
MTCHMTCPLRFAFLRSQITQLGLPCCFSLLLGWPDICRLLCPFAPLPLTLDLPACLFSPCGSFLAPSRC